MAVFSENMDKLDPANTAASLKTVESYIRYMGECIEFSTKNVTRRASEAGVSSAQMYDRVIAIENALSALQSVVNGMYGQITDTNTRITELQNNLTEQMEIFDNALSGLQGEVSGIQAQIEDLTDRVEALEETEEV